MRQSPDPAVPVDPAVPGNPVVLVTGGAGYVGSHVCKRLAAAGLTPVVVDDLSQGHGWAVQWGPLERCRLQDTGRLRALLAQWRPAAVLHFAALIAAGESVREPGRYWRNNVGGLLSLLEAMEGSGVRRLVFSSTAAVYGLPQGPGPIEEAHPLAPINPYGHSKLACEQILRDHGAAGGVQAVCLRYFNAAGADPEGRIGEAHAPETHLIPLAIRAAEDPGFTLDVLGDDYDTPDGTAVRDYVHVEDLAEAHLAALSYLEGGGAPDAFNLGSGRGWSVAEVVAAVEAACGRPVKRRPAPRRPGDPPVLVAAAGRARERLGWRTRRSDLASVVADAVAWHRQGCRPRAEAEAEAAD